MTSRPSTAAPAAISGLLLAAAAVLYVLGIGPAWWLARHGHITWLAYRVAYAPVLWCHNRWPACGRLVEHYIDLWRDP